MNHIIDRPFASPVSTSRYPTPYPNCTDSEPTWRLQERVNSNETPFDNDWTDQNIQYASFSSNNPSETTSNHTIKLLDQVPEGTIARQTAIRRFKHSCDPKFDFYRVTASIDGKIEVVNEGFERLAMYYCPDYKTNLQANADGHPLGIGIAGTTKYAQPAKWETTHSVSNSRLQEAYEESNSVTKTGYEISSLLWESVDSQDPVGTIERGNSFDTIAATLKSHDGLNSYIDIPNSICPGFIYIRADTLDGAWQVNGTIHYTITLTIEQRQN